MIRSESSASWKNIFSFLARRSGDVRGRSDEKKADLRRRLERFADGQIPDGEIDDLCKEISSSPDAMETLARLMRDPRKDLPE